MNLRESINDFLDLRDLSAAYLVRFGKMSEQQVMSVQCVQVLFDGVDLLVGDRLIKSIPRYFAEYLDQRDRLFDTSPFLFPTISGGVYRASKFTQRIKKFLSDANLTEAPCHPAKLSEQQWHALERIRFDKQRQRYQVAISASLCGFLGFRPSEVAKLIKKDLDFGDHTILLRDTKSQEDQRVPMPGFLADALSQYVSHLRDNDPLFVNMEGAQWDRVDVHNALVRYGNNIGLKSQVTPRRLRATVGKFLSDAQAPIKLIAALLRHKDMATTLKHYTSAELKEIAMFLDLLDEHVTQYDQMSSHLVSQPGNSSSAADKFSWLDSVYGGVR